MEFLSDGSPVDYVAPGLDVDIQVRTNPGSVVGIVSVDESVLLLAEPNDITIEKVCLWIQWSLSDCAFVNFLRLRLGELVNNALKIRDSWFDSWFG